MVQVSFVVRASNGAIVGGPYTELDSALRHTPDESGGYVAVEASGLGTEQHPRTETVRLLQWSRSARGWVVQP